MTGEVFVGSSEEYKKHNIQIDKSIWTRNVLSAKMEDETWRTSVVYMIINPNHTGELQSLDSNTKRGIKPFIRLLNVPDDYKCGDYFKMPNCNLIWQYLGDNIGISKEIFEPMVKTKIDYVVNDLNNLIRESGVL